MAGAVVELVGVKALLKDLNRLSTDENGPLFAAMKRAGYAAIQPIIPATRAVLPHLSDDLSNSLRASAYKSGAAVRMGGANLPYAPWIEFGGDRKRPHESHRYFLAAGRYLFPAARDLGPAAADNYTKALTEILGSTRVWTNTTDDGSAVSD